MKKSTGSSLPVDLLLRKNNVKRVAILASGAGSNAANILSYFRGSDKMEVVLIASNRSDAGVLDIAANHGIRTQIITKENFRLSNDFIDQLIALQVDLIVLAGFLWKVPAAMVQHFPQRIINIHPSLLPKYGGKGMYGHFVHEAVFNAGETESGITIHYVNEQYDEGAIIKQFKINIEAVDDAHAIEMKVRALEMEWFPKVIDMLLTLDFKK
jgi:phosphoribosylglycinamide formyltransferase-1